MFQFAFILFILFLPSIMGLPNPDPAAIQPLVLTPSPPATIPAFPEQSDVVGCPLDLPEDLFRGIKTACGGSKGSLTGELHRSRCCPVLAAWLYSAYSATALERAARVGAAMAGHSTSYDLPMLPDDSESCVNNLGKALSERGIELMRPNETCDAVYCFCGIRLHPLSCPEAFSVTRTGTLVGGSSVKKLERDCLSSSVNVNGFPGLGGCSKCLNALHLLKKQDALDPSKTENRTTKMHNKECQLMGLTWLLAKNRSAYFHTVSSVLRATMMSANGSDPQSCTLNSDDMPLAVDSSEVSGGTSPETILKTPLLHVWLLLLLSCVQFSLY